MKLLNIKTEIRKYDYFKSFIEEFNIEDKDLIFTSKFLYERYMKKLKLNSDFILKDKYGKGEPSDDMIDNIIDDLKSKNYSRIIAIGGGSIIDIAKLLTLKFSGNVLDLFEKNIPIIKEKELVVLPTTCGTGSEVTNISIVQIKEKQTKMGLAVDELYPDYAVLIPELMKELPDKFFVTSSVDALIHAVESFVSPKSNVYTELFSVKAIEMILNGYIEIINKGKNYRNEIIENFIMASNYAGIAFGNTGVGAVHALSYPLGGKYHVPHGEANYQFFLAVFRKYYYKNPNGKISKLNEIFSKVLGNYEDVYENLENILDKLLYRKPLREYGMKKEEIETFTDSIIKGQKRLLVNNYIELSKEDIISIYRSLY
ncbi:4-hydroxybutyrate dehydrogenase [Tepidibacter formicigenes]|jgi:4-hydroxybutyrate dehydrogenase|uniref:4-hydroxybutyrate dehydrogenase n=1 Tax=Tepidibacter formicigenes DSM 15518 TaxID=1123349 RepID=A0A1M6J739_9FIRM|nr:4-hydroxybutyrate dehydrogenase [Tepidibacter formicigenes]SHJ42475.1 4-hydroxybutyrate dehydrogenase [Tepidibacter formicigenes DSM 15518]